MSLPTEQETERLTPNRRARTTEAGPSLFEAFDPLKGKRLEVMDPSGKIVNERWMPEISEQNMVEIYRMMLLARIADAKAVSYQRQGRLFTLPPSMGQEACAVGSASVLEANDWMVPAYRELGALLAKGVPLWKIYLYHSGSEFGAVYPDHVRVLPQSVPISSQLLHAAGIGHAINYKGLKEVVITYFGDGGTSEGDFHEALNWAAVFDCPVIFFCNNNQYAISYPRARQTKSATLAQKAIAYGIPGIQVDGNDLFAVYRATREAAEHARSGKGPVLIEAETYRLGAHTTSDDPSRYRKSDEEKGWHTRDPLLRMRMFLEARKLWSEQAEEQAKEDATKTADEAFKQAAAVPVNTPDEVMNHMYEAQPEELKQQLSSLKEFLKWKEGR